MKKLLTSGPILVFLLLAGPWAASHGQSLGTPAAAAWIGRPLEMTVPARFAPADAGEECVHADVFFGDTRLPAHRVRATILGADPQRKQVRIETDTLIDEPVVTVSLRAGCRSPITRSYTLLPDLPSGQVLAALAAQRPWGAAPVAPLSPAMAAAAAMAPLQLAPATQVAVAEPPRPRAPATIAAAPRDGLQLKARQARVAPPAVAAAAARPRLRLEPLDLDSQSLLRVSARLADPAGDASRRAAAAMLWQAINAGPQEVLRTTVMLQDLERDLSQLRQGAAQTRADMAALRQRLDAVQPWYGSAAVLQLLALLLLASGAVAAILWYRNRHAGPGTWYAPMPDAAAQAAPDAALAPGPVPPSGAEPAQSLPPQEEEVPAPVPLGDPVPAGPDGPRPDFVTVLRERRAARGPQAAARPAAGSATAATAAAPAAGRRRSTDGALRVETLAATFDEVEFLSSLGLTADAAVVLQRYLQDSGSPAPIAFFEWMRLAEQAEGPEGAAAARRQYAEVFGTQAPRLEEITAPVGLEGLAALNARVTASWHTPQVLQVIEEALFAAPGAGAPLTLAAGRDLLCLFDVAMRLVTDASAVPAAGDGHALAPWAHAEDAAGAHAAMHAAAGADDGGALGVDIDLATAVPDPLPSAAPPAGARPPAMELLVAQMQAAAREAQERAAAQRRLEEQQEAFSAAVASERMPLSRH